jgi:hypothetical protein
MVTALARGVRLVLVAFGVRFLLGPWPAAALLAAGAMWWGLRIWHRWETRSSRRRALLAEYVTRTYRRRPDPGHVHFARALAAVAAEYLARCEQEAHQP